MLIKLIKPIKSTNSYDLNILAKIDIIRFNLKIIFFELLLKLKAKLNLKKSENQLKLIENK